MAIIETRGLTRSFGELVAVKDLSIEVQRGEVLGFLGPNGAGKTTTVRLLAGMIAPSRGVALVAGMRSDRQVEEVHAVIGLLTERPGFYARLSARRNLEFFARFYPSIDATAQAERYLREVGLWGRRDDLVGGFSKGMKQRLALARALVHEPPLLFLDEPTAGLDPEVAREVRQLVLQLKEEERTIFLCTHNLAEAELLCDRIAVFSTELVALDTAANLRQRLFRPQVVVELESPDPRVLGAVRELDFVRSAEREDKRLVVELADADAHRPALVAAIVEAGGAIQSVYEQQHSLEEVYLTLLREEKRQGTVAGREE